MNTKFCPACNQTNMSSAKYCMSCSEEFPNIPIFASSKVKTPVKKTPKIIQMPILDKDVDTEGDEIETDIDSVIEAATSEESAGVLINSLLDFVDSNTPTKNRGVKIEEVAGTAAGGKKTRRAPDPTLPKKGRDILASTKNRRNDEE